MKRYIITLFVLLAAFTACERYDADDHKFGNVVYLNVSQTSPVQLATFSNNRATYDCTLQAALTYPADGDVQVSLEVDPSLVAAYNARYGTQDEPVLLFAVGDGNHSLATAKACWEAIKPTLSDEARVDHSARFALCELVNLHSPALIFRPVHRVVFGAEIDALQSGFERYLRAHGMTLADGGEVTLVQGGARRGFAIQGRGDRLPVDVLQKYLDQACGEKSGWSLDYVHGDADAAGLAQNGATAALLGAMDKRTLFPAIAAGGVLPRKTFSMGEATEKRYYMECRRIDAKNP